MSPARVLIAEDDPSVRMTLQLVLDLEGFEVIAAEDGEQALAAARERSPDVILLDQVMPRMDGRQVLSALKQDDATRGIPVLVLTGMAQVRSDDWEGAEFVGKPFNPDDLVKRVRAALERRV
ncbi:MAG: response regulator [Actinomycetota bacterium]